MSGVNITIDEELLRELHLAPERAEDELRLELAVQLVREKRATVTQGARLARRGRLEFSRELGRRHVSIGPDTDDLMQDLQALGEVLGS